MVVSHGRATPKGSLPVFSVGSAAEAKRLIALACGTNVAGEHIARELATEQTLENLAAFSDRLERIHDEHVGDWCDCKPNGGSDA